MLCSRFLHRPLSPRKCKFHAENVLASSIPRRAGAVSTAITCRSRVFPWRVWHPPHRAGPSAQGASPVLGRGLGWHAHPTPRPPHARRAHVLGAWGRGRGHRPGRGGSRSSWRVKLQMARLGPYFCGCKSGGRAGGDAAEDPAGSRGAGGRSGEHSGRGAPCGRRQDGKPGRSWSWGNARLPFLRGPHREARGAPKPSQGAGKCRRPGRAGEGV